MWVYLEVEWVDEMSCRKGVWKFDTLCETTLWVRVKRHAIHHWLYSLCTEDMWKVTARSHGRLVENTLLIVERILYVTILCHNILLVFGLVISDIRMMSLISVDQWLWYIGSVLHLILDSTWVWYSLLLELKIPTLVWHWNCLLRLRRWEGHSLQVMRTQL